MAFDSRAGSTTRANKQQGRRRDRSHEPHLEWRGAVPLTRGVEPPAHLRLYTLTLTFPFRSIATTLQTDPSFPIRRIKTESALADFKLQWTEDGKVASVRLGGSLSALKKTADAVERYVYVEQEGRWSRWERDLLQRVGRRWCAFEETRVREVEGWELKEWAGDPAVPREGGRGGSVGQERWAQPMHPLSRRISALRGDFEEEEDGLSSAASERSFGGSHASSRASSSLHQSPHRWEGKGEPSASRLPFAVRQSYHRQDDHVSPPMSGSQEGVEEEQEDEVEIVWVVQIPASCTLRFCGPSSCTGYIETTNNLSISLSTTPRGSVNLELRAEGKGCRRRLEGAVEAVERVVEVDVEGWRAEVRTLGGRRVEMKQQNGRGRSEAGGERKGKKRKREWEFDEESSRCSYEPPPSSRRRADSPPAFDSRAAYPSHRLHPFDTVPRPRPLEQRRYPADFYPPVKPVERSYPPQGSQSGSHAERYGEHGGEYGRGRGCGGRY